MDYELYWDFRKGKQTTANQRNARWHTFTCVLGFSVMGVWAEGSDGTDVNAASRSKDGELLVTADDFGMVKLFNFPCIVEGAGHRAYPGHASFVMNVRFSPDDQKVVTAGGRDRAIFQHNVVRLEKPVPDEPEPELQWLPLDADGKAWGYRKPGPLPGAPADDDGVVPVDDDDEYV